MTEAVVLAGGLGTRLRSIVPDAPKPMALINNRPFLEYQLDYWITQGVSRFILSVGYMHEIIIAHFGDMYRGSAIAYAIEAAPLGTGGGLLQAATLLTTKEPFLVLNGDTFFEVPLVQLKQVHQKYDSEWTIALFYADATDRYGKVECTQDGRISRLMSGKAAIGESANGGVYLVSPDALDATAKEKNISLEQELLPEFLARDGKCYGTVCKGRFIDIGIPDDYARAGQVLTTKI